VYPVTGPVISVSHSNSSHDGFSMASATSLLQSPERSRSVPTVSERRDAYLSCGVVLAFLVVCVPLGFYLNIWQDEAYSLHSSGGSVVDAFYRGIGFEAQAPLYFVFLSAWRELSGSAFFARLLSIAFSLVTLLATWLFARRYIPKIAPYFVLAVVAFNPFVVWAAVEIRPYAASIAFSAVLLLLLYRGFLDERPSRSARIAYIFVAIFGTYTQYYVAFLLPAHLVALTVLRRWSNVRSFCLLGLAFALALLPLLHIVPSQFASYDAFAAAFKTPSYAMATVLFGYPFPHGWIGTWAHRPLENALYFIAAAIPIGLALYFKSRLNPWTNALLAIVGSSLCIYTAAIVVAHVQVLIPRHTLVLLVPILLCGLTLIGDVIPSRKSLVLATYLALYAVLAAGALVTEFRGFDKTGDWQRVANFVAANARPDDGVAIFNAEAELPFRYYFKRDFAVVAIPHAMSLDRFDEATFVLHSPSDVATSLGRVSQQHAVVWLVESDACTPPRYRFFGCAYLDAFVARRLRVRRVTHFDGTTVLQLQRR
jgi:hypothetical protein